MLTNIKWLMAKNDADKLVSLYDESKPLREQIIDRLREMGAVDSLLEVARRDPVNRGAILDDLMDKHALGLEQFVYVLSWLSLSMIHRRLLRYLIDNFSEKDLDYVLNHPKVDKLVKRNLKKEMGAEEREKEQNGVNDDYLQIRMLLEEVELDTDLDEVESSDRRAEVSSEMDRIKRYIDIRRSLNPQQEFSLIEKELTWWAGQDRQNLTFILSIINLSRLRPQDKLAIIRKVDNQQLLYPENFQFITESADLPFETFQAFFSLTTLREWVRTFLVTHFAVDLYFLFKHYEQFHWLENYLHSLSVIQNIDLVNFTESYYLTSQYGYRLNEIIPDETILRRLHLSCQKIHEAILANIHVEDFPLDHFLQPLLLVGGEENFAFIGKLMNRQVVDDPQQPVREIEQRYLQLKQRIHSPEELRELIDNELAEKNELISQTKYDTIAIRFFESITSANYLQQNVIDVLKDTLPDLDKFGVTAGSRGKALLCKFIGLLELEQYKDLLLRYTQEDDYNIAVHAAIALLALKEPKAGALLMHFVQSPNYMVRKQVASSLQILSVHVSEQVILKLAQDKHQEVCREAIRTIQKLPLSKALAYFTKIVPITYYKNRPYLAEALGALGTDLALPLLAELLKAGDSDDYQAVIRALGNINSKVAATMLRTLDLKKNPVLEIERARSLIRLGDTSAWRTLESYFDFNLGFVRDLAKTTFLQLASGEKLVQLRELSFDPSPVVSTLASGRLFLYDEEEGWTALNRLKNSKNADQRFYLVKLLGYLPFRKVRRLLQELETNNDAGCRMLTALIYADNGSDRQLLEVERNIFNVGQYDQKQVIRAIREYPNAYCLSLIKKLAMLNDPETIDSVLELLEEYNADQVMKIIMMLWSKSDEQGRISLARSLGRLRTPDVIVFAREQIATVPIPTKAELAYALIVQGDESGWDVLLQIMSDSNPTVMKIPIPILARLQSNEALDVLVRHMGTPSETIQAEVIKAIGTMQLRESLPLLQKYISNHSNKIKIAVAKALSEMDTEESRKMLAMLAGDHDEYVRVAVDIARQKQDKGLELDRTTSSDLFRNLFQFTDWQLPDAWFNKLADAFRKNFEAAQPQPVETFAGKVILTQDELDHCRGLIQDELDEKLIGCTDVDAIISAKAEAGRRVDEMATRDDLIRSILDTDCNHCGEEAWNELIKQTKSSDSDVINALVIASAGSENPRWLEVLDLVLQQGHYAAYIDMIIYSAAQKRSGLVIPLLMRILESERARYYLLLYFNAFLVHPDLLLLDHIKAAKNVLAEKEDLNPQLKDAAKNLLNTLVEVLL